MYETLFWSYVGVGLMVGFRSYLDLARFDEDIDSDWNMLELAMFFGVFWPVAPNAI